MNRLPVAGLILAIGAVAAISLHHSSPTRGDGFNRSTNESTRPSMPTVVVELFTSEGCSSCPPADALLDRLSRTQSGGGPQIIALEEHVDYWNYLGWRDPYSSGTFSARQSAYANLLKQANVYTPEAVVGGAEGVNGSDEQAVRKAVADAARRITLQVTVKAAGSDKVAVTCGPDSNRDSIYLAVTEDDLSQQVGAGENSGRMLKQNDVVRWILKIGTAGGDTRAIEKTLPLEHNWNRANLHIVAFAQRPDGAIVGAASTRL